MAFIRTAGNAMNISLVTRYNTRSKFETDWPILQGKSGKPAVFLAPSL